MIGFPLGGFLVDQFGVGWGFVANALSFAFSAALIARTVVPQQRRRGHRPASLDGLARGLPLRARQPPVRAVILVVALITLAAGIKSPLEPLFALDSLDAGADRPRHARRGLGRRA